MAEQTEGLAGGETMGMGARERLVTRARAHTHTHT